MKAAAHRGTFWDTFLLWKSSLKTWLTPSSNRNGCVAVLDLFNFFCIVLYVRFRYFLEFTFAILGSVLLEIKKTRALLETNGGETCRRYSVFFCFVFFLEGDIFTAGLHWVFWAVCTCSNSIYTTISMPLYSYLVCPVSLNFGIHS